MALEGIVPSEISQTEKDKHCVISPTLLLLLLSRFSRVRICATPEMAAHEAPPSLGFSRQEHWIGLPFPSPTHESESEVTQSCPTPSDPMDCSLPGSSVHGIFQARVLEWDAIAFSYISSHCYNKIPQHGQLINNRNLFLPFPKPGSLRPGRQLW